jgi:hypothetical protein
MHNIGIGKFNFRHCLFMLILIFMPAVKTSASGSSTQPHPWRISGEFRNLFFQKDFEGKTVDCEDLALGGKIRFETGEFRRLGAGISIYTAQGSGLNNDDKNVYGLLAKDENGNHESYTALGEAFLSANFKETTLKIGRQEMVTPWINLHDIRMTPQSFEALTIKNTRIPGLELFACRVNRIKKRTETTFQDMSLAVGASRGEPVTAGGMIFTGIDGVKLQLWDYWAHNMWNDIYVRGDGLLKLNGDVSLFANARCLYRKDTGDRIMGPIDTYMSGIQAGVSACGAELSLAYGRNGEQSILRPWGHDLAVSIQVYVAERAEETAWNPGFKYDFSHIGIEGLVAGVAYAVFNTPDRGPHATPDADEINFNLQYDCSRWVKGLNLQFRYAVIDEDERLGGEDYNDLRLCFRYRFDFSGI